MSNIEASDNFDFWYRKRELEQHDRAIAILERIVVLKLEESHYNFRAYFYREAKQCDRAIANYNKATEILPNYARAYKNSGKFYRELGNIARAKQNLKKAGNLYWQQNNTKQYHIVQQQLQQL